MNMTVLGIHTGEKGLPADVFDRIEDYLEGLDCYVRLGTCQERYSGGGPWRYWLYVDENLSSASVQRITDGVLALVPAELRSELTTAEADMQRRREAMRKEDDRNDYRRRVWRTARDVLGHNASLSWRGDLIILSFYLNGWHPLAEVESDKPVTDEELREFFAECRRRLNGLAQENGWPLPFASTT